MVDQCKDLKMVVVGDGAVGKTCLLSRFTNPADFNTEHIPTIFENTQHIHNHQNTKYTLDLWDTAGQENFDRLRPLSYKEVDCFLLCFSVENSTSLDNIKFKWLPEVRNHISSDRPVKLLLVGTKSDFRNTKDKECITPAAIEKVKNESNVPVYVECSALKNEKVQDVFNQAIELCVGNSEKPSGCCTLL